MSALLDGLRVLVVEDEFFVALELEAMIRDLGGTVAGPVGRLDAARTVMRQEKINCAILDVKLDGDTSLPLVDDLVASVATMRRSARSILKRRWNHATADAASPRSVIRSNTSGIQCG